MLFYFFAIFIYILGILLIDFSTASLFVLFFIVGTLITKRLNKGIIKIYAVKIFHISFLSGYTYILMCFSYMVINNYDYLLIFDTKVAYMPQIKEYLEFGKNGGYLGVVSHIWGSYNFYASFSVGFYTLATLFGYISYLIDSNLYVSIQIGILSLTSFTGVIIFRTLIANGISEDKSYKYSIAISLCTILFFYSTLIIRDGLIAFFFICLIYICFLPLTYRNLLRMSLLIALVILFRIESGIFSLLFIPLYILIINYHRIINRFYFTLLSTGFIIVFIIIVYLGYNYAMEVYNENYVYYMASVSEGDGIIGMLQRLPFGVRELSSILYTALQPIPFYAKMSIQYYGGINPESYNIMAYPTLLASFFNFFVIAYLFVMLVTKTHYFRMNRTIKSLIYFSFLSLGIQSAVVEQRRVMGFYIVFYIIFAMFHSSTKKRDRNVLNFVIVTIFFLIQISLAGVQF